MDLAARKKAAQLSGQGLVPVIQVDGLVLGDFDVGQLEGFLQEHDYFSQDHITLAVVKSDLDL